MVTTLANFFASAISQLLPIAIIEKSPHFRWTYCAVWQIVIADNFDEEVARSVLLRVVSTGQLRYPIDPCRHSEGMVSTGIRVRETFIISPKMTGPGRAHGCRRPCPLHLEAPRLVASFRSG